MYLLGGGSTPGRAPHHTISHAELVGGENIPKPGEISLAHRGVLFLDEFPEFGTRVLKVMRQPMEDKLVTISRAKGSRLYHRNQSGMWTSKWDRAHIVSRRFIGLRMCCRAFQDLHQFCK